MRCGWLRSPGAVGPHFPLSHPPRQPWVVDAEIPPQLEGCVPAPQAVLQASASLMHAWLLHTLLQVGNLSLK